MKQYTSTLAELRLEIERLQFERDRYQQALKNIAVCEDEQNPIAAQKHAQAALRPPEDKK